MPHHRPRGVAARITRVPQIVSLAAALTAALLAGCGSDTTTTDAPPTGDTRYDVQVTRTTLGIPHIRANDYASLGYGYGYAHAEDNLCVVMEDLVTIAGQRARFFGRDGSYTIEPNGATADNVSSDFFWLQLADAAAVARNRENTDAEYQAATQGFADGFSRYVREIQAGQRPGRHASCRAADWLRPITANDMYRRYIRLGLIASSSVLINEIANAAPPALGAPAADAPDPAQLTKLLSPYPGPFAAFAPQARDRFGSNMYALGAESTQDGSSMVFGNPHFPWNGTERLWLSHLTIPGELDIMGASLYAVPAVLIGFNDHVAWSHTVSTAFRFSLYELTLNPADPTQYFYDGALRDMVANELTIDVLEADGSLTTESRTLYESHYGPMLSLSVSGVPVLGWSNAKAYTLRDANAENDRLINQFARWNRAESLDEFIDLHGQVLGVPWVNTVASGPGGDAYYGDITVVPHVTDEQVTTCGAQPLALVLDQLMPGLPLLDGSRSACEWGSDDDAPVAGVFGPSNLPSQRRSDWVHNCNDSYWLTNPAEPITGFDAIIGSEATERSLRTRLCIAQIQQRLDGSDGLPGTGFTMDLLQEVTLGSRVLSAELARDSVLSSLCSLPTLLGSNGPVNVADACAVLADWDGRHNRDSRGGHIWREFFRNVVSSPLPVDPPVDVLTWLTPFSANDPVNTPNTLNVLSPTIQMAFADAVTAVSDAGVDLDARMGDLQRPCCISPDIELFGGEGFEGAFTITSSGPINADGYQVDFGNSYIQTVTWDDAGVQAEGFVTYSQSTDPASPHFDDFTRAYSAKSWQALPFTDAEIAADAISSRRLTE